MLIEAQQAANEVVAKQRVELLKALRELDEVAGEDNYDVSLREILKDAGGSLPLSQISRVFADGPKFGAVRKQMREGKEPSIREYRDPETNVKMVSLVEKPAD